MAEQDFEGRVALVTGGASGIGQAVATRFARRGADVQILDAADGSDVRDGTALAAAVESLPRLDVLVCSAGVAGTTALAAVEAGVWVAGDPPLLTVITASG